MQISIDNSIVNKSIDINVNHCLFLFFAPVSDRGMVKRVMMEQSILGVFGMVLWLVVHQIS